MVVKNCKVEKYPEKSLKYLSSKPTLWLIFCLFFAHIYLSYSILKLDSKIVSIIRKCLPKDVKSVSQKVKSVSQKVKSVSHKAEKCNKRVKSLP